MNWFTLAPLDTPEVKGKLTIPFDFGYTVHLVETPEWIKKAKLDLLSRSQRRNLMDSQYSFLCEYQAESLGDPAGSSEYETPMSKQALAHQRIARANMSLWIAGASNVGFSLMIHGHHIDENTIRDGGTFPRVLCQKDETHRMLTEIDLNLAKMVFQAFSERKGAIRTAFYFLWRAVTEEVWVIRYLHLWILLEALFGTETEIRFRISQRIALFLSTTPDEARQIFAIAKKGYDLRSKVVHGSEVTPSESQDALMNETEQMIRRALLRISKDNDLIKRFGVNKERNSLLDDLAFRG